MSDALSRSVPGLVSLLQLLKSRSGGMRKEGTFREMLLYPQKIPSTVSSQHGPEHESCLRTQGRLWEEPSVGMAYLLLRVHPFTLGAILLSFRFHVTELRRAISFPDKDTLRQICLVLRCSEGWDE